MSTHTSPRLLAMICALTLPTGTAVAAATPAHADVPVVTVSKKTAPTLLTEMSITVSCPSGKVPAGGGAETDGKAYLTESVPTPDKDGWKVTARKTSNAGPWRLTAIARCIDPPSNYEIVSDEDQGGVNAAGVAPCPANTRVLGMGGAIFGSNSNGAFLTGLSVDIDINPLFVAIASASKTVGASTTGWGVRAIAVCGSLSGVEMLKGGKKFNYTQPGIKRAGLLCPPTKNLLASGADLWKVPSGPTRRAFLTDISASEEKATHGGVVTAKETASHEWGMRPYAICA